MSRLPQSCYIWVLNLVTSGSYELSVDNEQPIDGMPTWFAGLQLNFAENILFAPEDRGRGRVTAGSKQSEDIAIIEIREDSAQGSNYTWGRLRKDTSALAGSMKVSGICKGDRVLAVASNSYRTLCVMLATTWLGGIFTSVSTETGVQGILDRASQIKPKLVFMEDGAIFNGKTICLLDKMQQVLASLTETSEFKSLISISRFQGRESTKSRHDVMPWETFVSIPSQQSRPPFEKLAFHDPMLIAFSSGTTGAPKGIVHSVGGILLNCGKETILHQDISPANTVLQYTTTSWIMYLAAVIPLFSGAKIVLYDGSPFYPSPSHFVRLLGDLRVTNLGTSPGWMQRLRAQNIVPRAVTDLSNLRMVTSTGMVLQNDLFEWFYDTAFPQQTQLFNMSGGTDIVGLPTCFTILEQRLTHLGRIICFRKSHFSPLCPALGVSITVMGQDSPADEEIPVPDGNKGELVIANSFPNVPVFFWGDLKPTSPQSKLFSSYFSRFNHKWTQGDLVSIDPITRAIHFYGRADGVLNPSGVRFGSAEIYGVIERRFPGEVSDSLCVGKKGKDDENEIVVLFLLMEPGKVFTEPLVQAVKRAIREDLSPRHVPAYVFETPEIPRTLNFKKVEIPVKRIISGERVKPSSTLLNPSSLRFYYRFTDLSDPSLQSKL
ncbi:hypothetical protein FSARC_10580 [Fusarium sarcochroum]|uniref:AMP-dependent synthetase/ligase domain-containing protein n=1 Tax=Fusarium sarcochroum TaxID=1208366 RepID=A0A8H4X3V2_9HYPO|nr:hypothetical protein FSARC_10580 [Fusarium sarcochroum]